MPSVTLSDLDRAEIIRLCEHDRDEHPTRRNFRPCVVLKPYLIKYDSIGSLYPQYKTQQYIYNISVEDASAPHIPKIYDFFTSEHTAYLVMEYIEPSPILPSNAPEKVAEAIQWLRSVPVPPDAWIGPVGGGHARHELFKDFEAPRLSGKEALEEYMNMALERFPSERRPKEISFADESLIFTQSNMQERNFLVDSNGKISLIDFQDVGLLPQSFASYTMSIRSPFVSEVAKYLDWPLSPNLKSMASASAIICVISPWIMRVDQDGKPIRHQH